MQRQRQWVDRSLLVVGCAFLAWMISRFPLADVADAVASLGSLVLITPLIAMGWFACGAAGLYHLLERAVPWRALMWNRVVGEGYNAVIPGGVGGEPVKLRHLQRYGIDTRRGVVTLIHDRFLDNAVGLAFSAICIAIGLARLDVSGAGVRTALFAYAIVASVAAIAIAIAIFTSVSERIGGRVARWFGASERALAPVARRSLVFAAGWFLLGRLWGLLEVALLFWLLDLPVDPITIAFTNAAITAAGFVGAAIPQGIGVAEGAIVGVFELLHFSGPAAIAYALARRGRMLLLSSLGVILHLVFGRRAALAR